MELLKTSYYILNKSQHNNHEIRSTKENPRLLYLGIDLVHDELLVEFAKFFRSRINDTFSIRKMYKGEVFPDSITCEKGKGEWYASFNGDGFIIPFEGVTDFYKCLNTYINRE